MRVKLRVICLVVVAALALGCTSPAGRLPAAGEVALEPRVWPSPPLQPRIRLLRTVARPADLGIRPSFWQRVGKVFTGKQEEWFIRPIGVAATGQALYVADPGAQAVWILKPAARRFRRLREAGQQRLISPVAVALGQHEQLYLADSFLAKVFVYDADEKLQGTIADATLQRPAGLAYDAARDRLYVADSAAHRVWIFTGDGRPLGAIGQRGTGNGEFNFPTYVTVDDAGILYVTDSMGFRVQFFSPGGAFAGQFGKHGDTSGDFARPKGIAVDSEGHIYVVEALFDSVQIFDRQGQFLLFFGERGLAPGQFWLPGGIYIDAQDRIYVADAYNQRIQIFEYLAGGDNE
jgi:hypothetical protein